MVVTETPSYEPSRWLESIITYDFELVSQKDITIEAKNLYSINQDILKRRMKIWEVPCKPTPFNAEMQSLILRYARWHSMEGTPRGHGADMSSSDNAYGVQQAFNTWQIEQTSQGMNFTWLKTNQRLSFPKKTMNLQIDYLQGIPPKNHSTFWYTCRVNEKSILISRKTFKRTFKFTLQGFYPSSLEGKSTDHRLLTIAAVSFKFF